MGPYRAWAEIDLDALGRNLDAIRRRAGEGVRVLLVVKADAYGHGALAVAHHALRCGIWALGVGTSSEALALRRGGVRTPILVLGTVVDDEVPPLLAHGVEVGLHSLDRLRRLEHEAARASRVARVHLNVDTGMGRLGVLPERALALLEAAAASPHLELAGVMTHYSATEGGLSPAAWEQERRFRRVLDEARAAGLSVGCVHASNSAALFTGMPSFDAVRPGIAALGVLPEGVPGREELEPVMALRTQVVFLKDLPAGAAVGYGSTWRAPRPTRIATLPLGYADGLPWRASGSAEVLIRGRRAPIVGRISMDYTTIDVGHVPGARVGDTVTILGRDGAEEVRVEDLAARAGTIPYEVTCSIGPRVERLPVGGEDLLVPRGAVRERTPAAAPADVRREHPSRSAKMPHAAAEE